MQGIINPLTVAHYSISCTKLQVIMDREWVLMKDFLLGPSQADYHAISLPLSLRSHSSEPKPRVRESLQSICKEMGPLSRKVTGAVSDFRPWYGSAGVGLVKPRRPCPPFTSLVRGRDDVIHMLVGVCVCVCLYRQEEKVSLWLGSKQEKALEESFDLIIPNAAMWFMLLAPFLTECVCGYLCKYKTPAVFQREGSCEESRLKGVLADQAYFLQQMCVFWQFVLVSPFLDPCQRCRLARFMLYRQNTAAPTGGGASSVCQMMSVFGEDECDGGEFGMSLGKTGFMRGR